MSILKDLVFYINKRIMANDKIAIFFTKVFPSFKLMFGKEYTRIVESGRFRENPDTRKLFLIVNSVLKSTAYYKDKVLGDIKDVLAFEEKLKPFDKEVLRNYFERLISDNYDVMTTGGTSGAPTRFYVPKNRFKKEYAFYHKIWGVLGYKEHLRAVLRNEKLAKNKYYKINPITRELIFDGFRNNDDYYHKIYTNLLKFGIEYIQGYPSSIYSFFVYVKKEKLDISFIKGVFLSSEVFLKHQRKLLIDNLKLPVISVYGHSEKLVLAVDFSGKNEYQVIEEYGYLELLNEKGEVIKETGKLGEIVGTTFDNYGMPLLRYKTGDYSSYLQHENGNARILNGIQGRWEEMKIYNKDNSFVTPTALNLHDELYDYIDGLQYFQGKKGELEIRIIPNEKFNNLIETKLLNHFKERMASNTLINMIKVNELTKKKNGKFLLLETLVN